MKIIVDVMGADNAPKELVKGAVMASRESKLDIVLVGKAKLIDQALEELGADKRLFTVVDAKEVITMEDDPFDVVRVKKESSMAIGLKMLSRGEGDAFVGAGNTGALFSGATVIVHPIKNIRRAAIAAFLPFERPLLLLDSGANASVTAEYLEQFAMMGEVYSSRVIGTNHPEVGLLNNGTEEHKGTPVVSEAHKILKESDINFIGNIEGKDIPNGKCDVLVTDGFTGNIVLKYTEGMGSFMMRKIKGIFFENTLTKISALLVKKNLMKLKKEFSASEYGGAPFLGIAKPVIKAHGNSDAAAIKNAIFQAEKYCNTGVIELIEQRAAKFVAEKSENK